jgi:hypothetical protein
MNVNMLTGDASHVGGQVTIGRHRVHVADFEVSPDLNQDERENAVIDKALELNPDIALTRAKNFACEKTDNRESVLMDWVDFKGEGDE